MIDELEWLTKSHAFIRFAASKGMNGRPPPTLGKLNPVDLVMRPEYVITGVLNREHDGTRVFEMTLWRLEDSALLAVQELAYTDLDEGVGFIPFFVLSLYSTLPGVVDFDAELKSWKNKWLYAGVRAGFSPRFYTISGENIPVFAFDAGLRAEAQLFPRVEAGRTFSFGLQTGLDFTFDSVDFSYNGGIGTMSTPSLSMPLVAKFNLKPGQFVFGPYGGFYFTHPLSDYKIDIPFGYTLGFNIGYKIGATGALFFDFHFSGDIGKTTIPEYNVSYNRYLFTLAMGFEWGFLTKKPTDLPEEEIFDDGTETFDEYGDLY
ncbi:MAG: PorT family protein [Treponema sp.]|nr:PorT family protein [Treponema sp.]